MATSTLLPEALNPIAASGLSPARLSHLQLLEAESIHIFREVAAEFQKPVMLYSIGKDSSVMLRLAQKAFFPAPIPFPLLHIDTGYKFREMIEFRDSYTRQVGVKLIVHGETFISRSGVTSATFKTVPEAPFESAEVSVPTGPYSEFAANGNLCKVTKTVTVKKKVSVKRDGKTVKVTKKVNETKPESLKMPIEFTASDGQQIKEETPIGVTGCTKSKPAKKTAKKRKKGTKKK